MSAKFVIVIAMTKIKKGKRFLNPPYPSFTKEGIKKANDRFLV